jgi:transposase
VESVGPARFGVVAVDSAKASSRGRLAAFYGRVLVPPTTVAHRARDFDTLIPTVRAAQQQHRLGDPIVAVERTGRYHLPLKRAFAAAGFEVHMVDPLATHRYRKPVHAGTKTDAIDPEAIHRAAVHGFGRRSPPLPPEFLRLQHWARHRRDLVQKTTRLRCQIWEHLHAMMPGFAELCDDLFHREIG